MSRPPIRDVFRLARLGLDKVALACAAFSLMHASARAAEAPAAEAVSIDQWAAQSSDQVARRSINDDAWVNLSAAHVAQDDAWSAPPAPLRVATPPRETLPVANEAIQQIQPPQHASALVMDGSDWNATPRGRSPGLIAGNNAWRNRIAPETARTIERNPAEQNRSGEPATASKYEGVLQPDPWSVSAAPSVGADNAADWQNLKVASTTQQRTCSRDWSIFSGAGCLDSRKAADPAKDQGTGSANPRPL